MARGSFHRFPCELCGKHISNAGLAYKSHMRMHVRKGEAREVVDGRDRHGTFTKFVWDRKSVQPDPMKAPEK